MLFSCSIGEKDEVFTLKQLGENKYSHQLPWSLIVVVGCI